jgi:hypothetical protein
MPRPRNRTRRFNRLEALLPSWQVPQTRAAPVLFRMARASAPPLRSRIPGLRSRAARAPIPSRTNVRLVAPALEVGVGDFAEQPGEAALDVGLLAHIGGLEQVAADLGRRRRRHLLDNSITAGDFWGGYPLSCFCCWCKSFEVGFFLGTRTSASRFDLSPPQESTGGRGNNPLRWAAGPP